MRWENSEIPKLGTTWSVIATGDSAKNWTPNGYSLGVNDAWKWGKPTDGLLICNRPAEFTHDRMKVIENSKPKDFYSHKASWAHLFPEWKRVRLHVWSGLLHTWPRSDGPSAYSYNSSPIIALTLAYNLGAKEIILWGVDFRTHWLFNDKNEQTKREVRTYLEVFDALKEKDVSIYRGADGSAFDDKLPRYGIL